MTDSSAVVQARYDYDPYGRRTKASGSVDADFGFTGYYLHATSGLNLAPWRAYDADTSKWLSRDPIGEDGGLNLYNYVNDDPLGWTDALGLSRRDGALIVKRFRDKVDQMTKDGERVNHWWNNIRVNILRKGKGCAEQADSLTGVLTQQVYDDRWTISHVRVLHPIPLAPFHQFVIAKSSNPEDPTFILDPYYNTIDTISPGDTYSGLIIDSETWIKEPGKRKVPRCLEMKFY